MVDNGVRQVMISLTRHIPSHLTIADHRVLISYDGQPTTCYGCGDQDHMYQGCPKRYQRRIRTETTSTTPTTYASGLSHTEFKSHNHTKTQDKQQEETTHAEFIKHLGTTAQTFQLKHANVTSQFTPHPPPVHQNTQPPFQNTPDITTDAAHPCNQRAGQHGNR
jgi:hypothetical protein